jgi:hypothetical protein
MSRAVGAQAFTHGADVFYGAGHGPNDLLLTAHELTHVVQQTGGRAPVQRSPIARAVSRSLQPVVQRYAESVPVRGMGSGVGPSTVKIGPLYGALNPTTADGAGTPAYLPFDRALETVTLAEDVIGGTVSMNIFESADINNMTFNDTQWTSWKGIVPFTVSGDQVTFGAAIQQAESGGSGAVFSAIVGSGATPGGGYVTIGMSVGASGGMTLGGGIGVGPVSASSPATGTSNYTGGLMRTFTVNVRPTPPKPIPGPDISFKVGLAKLADGQEGVISKWFEALPDATKDMIRNGKRTISISGYASTTGKRAHNRDLSESRAHVVERILRGHAGSNEPQRLFPRRRQRDDARREGRSEVAPCDAHGSGPEPVRAGCAGSGGGIGETVIKRGYTVARWKNDTALVNRWPCSSSDCEAAADSSTNAAFC